MEATSAAKFLRYERAIIRPLGRKLVVARKDVAVLTTMAPNSIRKRWYHQRNSDKHDEAQRLDRKEFDRF